MLTTHITSPDDPRIAPYTAIRERDLTGRGDRFIVEGKIALEVLVRRGRFALESVLVSTARQAGLADAVPDLPEGVPVYTASPAVMSAIAGFDIHRGVLACALKAPPEPLSASLERLPGRATLLVAIGLSNHDNTGALFRNAAAFAADLVLLDAQSCDPLYRKSIRVSAGTALWLPFHHGGEASPLLDTLEAAGFACLTLTPRSDAVSLADLTFPDRTAIIVGPEGPGLPDAILARGTPVRIPMAEGVDSLNVATAAALVLSRRFDAMQDAQKRD